MSAQTDSKEEFERKRKRLFEEEIEEIDRKRKRLSEEADLLEKLNRFPRFRERLIAQTEYLETIQRGIDDCDQYGIDSSDYIRRYKVEFKRYTELVLSLEDEYNELVCDLVT